MKKLILLGIILSQFSSVHASVFYQDGATINTTLKTACWNGKTGFNVFGRSDISCVKLSDEEVQNAIEINSRLNTERERNNHHKEYVYIAIMIFFTIVVLVHGQRTALRLHCVSRSGICKLQRFFAVCTLRSLRLY